MQNLCGMTQEEIINMISKVRAICVANDCKDCPFGNDRGFCIIEDAHPCNWEIRSDKETWRAVF